MSLQEWTLSLEPPPTRRGDISAFIRESMDRVNDYYDSAERRKTPRFVPSDYYLMNDVLHTLRRDRRCRGTSFLEWGCGFAVVAGLAAHYGFEARGIEIESRLVVEARALMRDFSLPVEIGEGDMIPSWLGAVQNAASDSYELYKHAREPRHLAPEDAGPAYEELGITPADIDIFFAYPWPDEIQMVRDLFDRVADYGALLVLFQGAEDYHVLQRI